MHILITADAVGGVWTYARELVSGLLRRGHRVTLVSLGKLPTQDQVRWMDGLAPLTYYPTEFRLEWMQNSAGDVERSMFWLERLIAARQPDLVHLNQYAYGALAVSVPKLIVAHSDVISWWAVVHGQDPAHNDWLDGYRQLVTRGLRGADLVVVPSSWMGEAICRHYPGWRKPGTAGSSVKSSPVVIHNGRTPSLFNPQLTKDNAVVAVGRLWDEAKQVSLLFEQEHPVELRIIGSSQHPEHASGGANRCSTPRVKFYGVQSEAQLSDVLAHSAIYAATSRYEPFGLALVEAALSRCALVVNDIPTFRQLWADCVYYFQANDANSLARAIRTLSQDQKLRAEYAERAYRRALENYSSDCMVDNYETCYRLLVRQEVAV